MVIRSVLPSLGSSQRQILYFGQRRDYKGDGVSPSVVLRLSNCKCYAPISEHLHLARKRTVFIYAIASIVCTVLYLLYIYSHDMS